MFAALERCGVSDWAEDALVAVMDKYGLPEPGYGERPMRCPVHDDQHASASVNRAKGVWFCHACGKGGDAVSLVEAMESVDYASARRVIEALVGVSTGQERPLQGVSRKRSTRWVPPSLRRAI